MPLPRFHDSTIQPFNDSTIQRFNRSTVQPFNDSTIQRFNDSTIQPFNDSTIQRFNHSTIQPFNDSTIQPPLSFLRDLLFNSCARSPRASFPVVQSSLRPLGFLI